MNEGMPYLQMRRGVWVSFCKIAIVSFLSVGYKSDGLYCRMEGTPSSPSPFHKSRDILLHNRTLNHPRLMNLNARVTMVHVHDSYIGCLKKHQCNFGVHN